MKAKLQKLRKASLKELRVRSSQALNAFMERHDWSSVARLPNDLQFMRLVQNGGAQSPLEFVAKLRQRQSPTFFSSFKDPAATIDALRVRWPHAEAEIIERADRIRKGEFDLLGFNNLSFGMPIDWHLEPVARKRSPLVHWSKLNYLDGELIGDKKIVWELNRHQYFATLGQAYWLTSDERYVEVFAQHVEEWIAKNPPKLGINWASSLEVSFRSISWIWALAFFRDSRSLTSELTLRILKVLYVNALHLETFLSTYFSPNTHLTGEALGLFYIGTLLPEFKEARRWRELGLQILMDQLAIHVQSDGVYFEQSSYYHRYTTDFYLHLLLLLSANQENVDSLLPEKLTQLLDHLMYITRPDGSTPLFGDDDGGRLVKLDYRRADDFRATLMTGAAVFKRGDYKFVAGEGGHETLWLVGPTGLEQLDQTSPSEPLRQSVGFETAGYFVMRDGWTRDANYLLFDCGPHGTDNCGHAHADALSVEVSAQGQTFVVDPGTCTYTGSKEMRDRFRGSAGHNTLTVDGEQASVPAGPFSWRTIAECRTLRWITQERFDYVLGAHDGFERLDFGSPHYREILFVKKNYWVISDYLNSNLHNLAARFHFDAGIEPLRGHDNGVRVLGETGTSVILQLAAFAEHGKWIQEKGQVSHCYGAMAEAPVFAFCADGAEEITTFAIPEPPGYGSTITVREIEALAGRAFEVNVNGKHDVLMFRGPFADEPAGRIETTRFVSDFDVAWVRFASEDAKRPEELVLVGGQTVELDGCVLLKSTKFIDYLSATAVGDRFEVSTSEGKLELSLPVMDLESVFTEFQQ